MVSIYPLRVQTARLQLLQQPLLLQLPPSLRQGFEGVEEGVECGVEGQHEGGHAYVDLARDGDSAGSHHPQQADGEPAEEVGHHDGRQVSGDDRVLGLLGGAVSAHRAGSDCPEDDGLAYSYGQEQDEVDDDHDSEGVVSALEALPGDGQGDTNASLTVEPPV